MHNYIVILDMHMKGSCLGFVGIDWTTCNPTMWLNLGVKPKKEEIG